MVISKSKVFIIMSQLGSASSKLNFQHKFKYPKTVSFQKWSNTIAASSDLTNWVNFPCTFPHPPSLSKQFTPLVSVAGQHLTSPPYLAIQKKVTKDSVIKNHSLNEKVQFYKIHHKVFYSSAALALFFLTQTCLECVSGYWRGKKVVQQEAA